MPDAVFHTDHERLRDAVRDLLVYINDDLYEKHPRGVTRKGQVVDFLRASALLDAADKVRDILEEEE